MTDIERLVAKLELLSAHRQSHDYNNVITLKDVVLLIIVIMIIYYLDNNRCHINKKKMNLSYHRNNYVDYYYR